MAVKLKEIFPRTKSGGIAYPRTGRAIDKNKWNELRAKCNRARQGWDAIFAHKAARKMKEEEDNDEVLKLHTKWRKATMNGDPDMILPYPETKEGRFVYVTDKTADKVTTAAIPNRVQKTWDIQEFKKTLV